MKNLLLLLIGLVLSFSSFAQMGVNTDDPRGALDVTTKNNMGLVLPRVSSIEDVTDGMGNPPLNGTTVYDISRGKTCFFTSDKWLCLGVDGIGNPLVTNETVEISPFTYIKASNTEVGGGGGGNRSSELGISDKVNGGGGGDQFGASISLSTDGTTMVIGATTESSNATGINGDGENNSAFYSGAVYVFTLTGGVWSQEAYIKASNTDSGDSFGASVSLSGDGNTLAVGAFGESSNATGINGIETDNSLSRSGAVYVFSRTAGVWGQEAYVKASNTESFDAFGGSVSLSSDGNTLAVSASGEGSSARGINGDDTDNAASSSGAAYVFTRVAGAWSQEAYIKASNTESFDAFGAMLDLSGDGNTLAVGASNEGSNATGIGGDELNNIGYSSGAVYVFTRAAGVWSQQAYVKASNANPDDRFGGAISLNSDGNTMVVGVSEERSNATGVNGDETNNSLYRAGAAYVFTRSAAVWSQEAYIKAATTSDGNSFGNTVCLSDDGDLLLIGAQQESSGARGIDSDDTDNSAPGSGAAYIFMRTGGVWAQESYVKASNTDQYDNFGSRVSVSGNGAVKAFSAIGEASNARGINGDESNNSIGGAGAVYVLEAP